MGPFNNNVEQIFQNFNYLSPLSGQLWIFYITFVYLTKFEISTDHLPTSSHPSMYVVIECPPWPRLVVVAGQGSTQSLDNTRFSFLFTHNLKMLLSLFLLFS